MSIHLNGRGPQQQSPARSAYEFVMRNRYLTFGAPLLLLAATLLFIRWTTPVYYGAASLRIDEDRSNIAVLDALKELSAGASIYTEMAELKSRSVAESVVDSLALHFEVQQPRRIARSVLFSDIEMTRTTERADYLLERIDESSFQLSGTSMPPQTVRVGQRVPIAGGSFVLTELATRQPIIEVRVLPFQVAVRSFQTAIQVGRPEREADIVEIGYESTDRELTRAVPNTTAALFIQRRQNVKTQQARKTVAFLDDQLDTLGLQLKEFEAGLQEFREGAGAVAMEAAGEAQVNRLAQFQADRDLADAERRSLAALFAEIDSRPVDPTAPSPYRRLLGFPSLLRSPAASQILTSLNEVENERALLLTRLTPADPDVQILTQRVRELEEQLRSITMSYLQGLGSTVASLDAVLARFGDELRRIPAKEIQLARLRRQANVTEEIYTTLQTRMKEAQIIAAVEDPSVRIVDPAILPLKPIRPNVPFNIVLALILGVVIGLAAAFMKETLDTTIHTREELQVESGAVPVLGSIPRIRETEGVRINGGRTWWRVRPAPAAVTPELRRSRLVAGRNPRGAASEAYRTLRTNIAFARAEKPAKTMVFTSPAPGDGKSTSASNLAITLAQQGLRAVLIDADMRRGAMHEAFDVPQRPGLSDYLLGGPSLEEVIRSVSLEGAQFDFIPTGTLPPNPAELLASPRMQALLEHLDGEYNAVIFDAPPLNVVTDAAILGSRADGVILVVRAGVTDRGALRYALDQLEAVRARVLGSVLNDVDAKRERTYGSYIDDRYYEVKT